MNKPRKEPSKIEPPPPKSLRLTPEPSEWCLQAHVFNTAGIDVILLGSKSEVGGGAKSVVAVGVVLSLTDVTLVHQFPVLGPYDVDLRWVEFIDEADESVGHADLDVLLRVDHRCRTV